MTVDERVKMAQLSIFVPEDQAAICADCRGVFLYVNGQCPGCGSKQWVLLKPAGDLSSSLSSDLQAKLAAIEEAFWEARDIILNGRGPMAESGMASEQVNDVLGVLDDTFSMIGPPPHKEEA